MFTISFVNLDHALCLFKLMTLNKHISGKAQFLLTMYTRLEK
jgi:hypothetical protein